MRHLNEAFAAWLTIDTIGPSFGYEVLLAEIAESNQLARPGPG
ncbi:hypothetical protein FHU38_001449 [Saccharomonospora amisosensis]|uniref:Uncharacterized protein n=1 Tax=Saccharomonospora amisosensis TaxID=1128677 RepID=A0A7X5UN69_9PSEU|nr:hypothetical protein [Saccharomonospora amisosensis]NIJ11105.1 hypothetical protein [Saccharomonospora amisosensis]